LHFYTTTDIREDYGTRSRGFDSLYATKNDAAADREAVVEAQATPAVVVEAVESDEAENDAAADREAVVEAVESDEAENDAAAEREAVVEAQATPAVCSHQ
jgi:hypothetical protein